jgi:CheY-like chemotaxis protein
VTPRTVLVVDDLAMLRRLVRLALERLGEYRIIEAEDGAHAVDAVARERPDAVLLDLAMPGLSGTETLVRIRALPGGAQVPVVFLTANVLPGDLDRFRALGAAGVIAKPFDAMTLPTQLAELLGWSQAGSGGSDRLGD